MYLILLWSVKGVKEMCHKFCEEIDIVVIEV